LDTEKKIQITLTPKLSDSDRELAVRYLLTPRSITPKERIRVLGVFDELAKSTIGAGEKTESFAAFYRALVEDQHALTFFEQLLEVDDPERVGSQLLQEVWQRIVSDLRTMGIALAGDIGQQCLVAFCGYWWQAFGKGYIREVAVFRDLERNGILFTAHDLRQRQERFTPYDLTIQGFRGDVKTSTYFLHMARSFPLANDFYLVRVYDTARRTWLDVAMIKPAIWEAINGDTKLCELDDIAQFLPTPLQVVTRDETLVVITYEDFKRRIIRMQEQRKE
jgi:hypothetical protein